MNMRMEYDLVQDCCSFFCVSAGNDNSGSHAMKLDGRLFSDSCVGSSDEDYFALKVFANPADTSIEIVVEREQKACDSDEAAYKLNHVN